MDNKIVDHLFRHQYGKMVAILTRFFGLVHLETIEDAVQDTFIQATLKWRRGMPNNPEAWLTKAAKNRTIDLLRKIDSEQKRVDKLVTGTASIPLNVVFLDHEVEDSQLRMLFVACHPSLQAEEQIAFALKTISGFSTTEIAAALLTKEETIKKRLSRARKSIVAHNIQFDFPAPNQVNHRLTRVMEVIYLTFNEGFHSTNKKQLVREDLCGEAIRLCKLLMKKERFRSGSLYALFALLCFHASRLASKTNAAGEIMDLKSQDRKLWHWPLIGIANDAMNKAMRYEDQSIYHYEAAIAGEHVKARSFDQTNWKEIIKWYEAIDYLQPTPSTQLNRAMVYIQMHEFDTARALLDRLDPTTLGQRRYLYHGCFAEYFTETDQLQLALSSLEESIHFVSNELEKNYLLKKKRALEEKMNDY